MSRARPVLRTALLPALLLSTALAAAPSAQLFLGEFGSGIVTAGDQTGSSVAIIGDVNGDGTDDMVIGAPYDDDNGMDSGTVYVVNGHPGTLLYELHGSAPGALFGYSVARMSDADGDGLDDFVVGSPGIAVSGPSSGAASVYSGVNGFHMYSVLGPKSGSFFGTSVGGGGDLNGDNRGDFIVGAPSWDKVTAIDNEGWAGIYSGAAGNLLKTWPGADSTAGKGAAVAFVGDLNSDDRVDYAIGAPGYDYSLSGETVLNAGRLDVYSGLDHTPMFGKRGGAGQRLGTSVSRAGDTDADGLGEVLVGAPGHAGNSGSALLYANTGMLLHQFFANGYTVNDAFGTSVGPLGDVDHDGHDDLLIGAPIFGFVAGEGGYAQVISGATYGPGPYGGVIRSFTGGDSAGRAVSASAGDLSGDDWNDMLVGWPGNDFAGSLCGVVKSYVLIYTQPNLNFQGPGVSTLTMYGTPLHSGGVADLALAFSKPNSPAYLIASPVELLGAFKGGTLVPAVSPAVIQPFMTNSQGRLKLVNIPGGGGPLILFMQFLVKDTSQPQGWQLSNAIAAEFLP